MIRTISGKPKIIPNICGIVFLYPNVRPEDNSIILLGPGDITVDMVKVAIDKITAVV